MWFLHHKLHEPWAFHENVFTDEECDNIIELGKSLTCLEATVGDYNSQGTDSRIRKNKISWIQSNEDTAWIYARLTRCIDDINEKFWNFDLDYIEPLQFTQYEENADFYGPHIDLAANSFNYRKLSFSVQLSNPEDYDGSNLIVHSGMLDPSAAGVITNRGSVNYFPSYMLHEVTPLVSGTRHALVGWVNGPQFK